MHADHIRLARAALFQDADPELLAGLLPQVEVLAVAQGESVVHAGAPAEAFYVLLAGALDVVLPEPDGAEVRVARIGPGESFGEPALLPGADRRRSATVRGAAPRSRVGRFPAAVLDTLLARDPALEARLRTLKRRHAANDRVHRSALMRALLAARPEPEQIRLDHGAVLFRQGEPATDFSVVLRGRVGLYDESGAQPIRRATLGPGLCVGEEDADTRAYTAVADGEVRLSRFPRGALRGLGQTAAQAQLATVADAWRLPQRGYVTRYLREQDGLTCLGQVFDLPGGRRVLASHVLGEEAVQLQVVGAEEDTRIGPPDGSLSLGLTAEGHITAVQASRRSPLFAALYARALDGTALTPPERRALVDRGALEQAEDRPLCACLRVHRATIDAAIAGGARSLAALQRETGAGLGCGSCLGALESCLDDPTWLAATVSEVVPLGETHRLVRLAPVSAPPEALRGRLRLRTGPDGAGVGLRTGAAGPTWDVLVCRDSPDPARAWLFAHARAGATAELGPAEGPAPWGGGPEPVVCLVEGEGVARAVHIASTLLAEGWPNRVVLHWSGAVDPTVLAGLLGLRPPPGPPPTDAQVLDGPVSNLEATLGPLDAATVSRILARLPTARVELAGRPAFCAQAAAWVAAAGIPPARIHRSPT